MSISGFIRNIPGGQKELATEYPPKICVGPIVLRRVSVSRIDVET